MPVRSPILRDQRGAISILVAAIIVVLAGLFSLAVDAGNLYATKRRLQGAVDLAALRAASNPQDPADLAEAVIRSNLADGWIDGPVTVEMGSYPPPGFTFETVGALPVADRFVADGGEAIRVTAGARSGLYLARFFHPGPVAFRAQSVAVNRPIAQLAARSGLATVDSAQAAALDAVLGGMLGSAVSLSALSYQGLANADISLVDFLDATAAVVGTDPDDFEALLGATLTLPELTGVATTVVAGDPTLAGSASTLSAALTALGTATGGLPMLRVGDILQLDTERPGRVHGARLNLLDLFRAAAQGVASRNGLTGSATMPIAGGSATVHFAAVEPEQFSALGGEGISVRTAQTRALTVFTLPGAVTLAGIPLTLRLPIYLELASGSATVTRISCVGPDATGATVEVDAQSSAATLEIGSVDAALLPFDLPPAVSDALLIDAALIRVSGRASASVGATEPSLTFGPPFDRTNYRQVQTEQPLGSVASDLIADLQMNVDLLSIPLVTPAIVQNAVVSALTLVAPTLDAVYADLLEALGVRLGYLDVGVNHLQCSNPMLVQ